MTQAPARLRAEVLLDVATACFVSVGVRSFTRSARAARLTGEEVPR